MLEILYYGAGFIFIMGMIVAMSAVANRGIDRLHLNVTRRK